MLNLFDNPIHPVNNATKKIFFLNIKKKKKKEEGNNKLIYNAFKVQNVKYIKPI